MREPGFYRIVLHDGDRTAKWSVAEFRDGLWHFIDGPVVTGYAEEFLLRLDPEMVIGDRVEMPKP